MSYSPYRHAAPGATPGAHFVDFDGNTSDSGKQARGRDMIGFAAPVLALINALTPMLPALLAGVVR